MFQVRDDDFKNADEALLEYDGGKDEFESKFVKVADMTSTMAIIVLVLCFCTGPIGLLIASAIDKNGCNKPLAMLGGIVFAIAFGTSLVIGMIAPGNATAAQIGGLVNLILWCYTLFVGFKNYQYNAKNNKD